MRETMMEESGTFEMAPYVEKASRLELIIRWLYGIVIGILYYLWAIYISIVELLQFFHILIFGRRGVWLYSSTRRYLAAYTHVTAYLTFLTDQRPELTPDLSVFFKRVSPSISPPVAPAKFCVSCGVAIQNNAKFCGNCGTRQP
jgi:hypothetical protein